MTTLSHALSPLSTFPVADGEMLDFDFVPDISAFDLSPIHLDELVTERGVFRFYPPREILPIPDETGQFYILRCADLGIEVMAHTRDELMDMLSGEVEYLWETYALEADEKLTPAAQALKTKLRAQITEVVGNATR